MVLLLIGITGSLGAQPIPFRVEPDRSTVEFSLGAVAHTVHGAFRIQSGNLVFDPATGKASGEVVVSAASGSSGNASRDKKMHETVLESARYSGIVFRPDRIDGKFEREGRSDLQAHGMFTIHGADHEITAPVSVEGQGGQYRITVRFAIPYIKWGLKNPSNLFLKVSDKVEITLHLAITDSTPGLK